MTDMQRANHMRRRTTLTAVSRNSHTMRRQGSASGGSGRTGKVFVEALDKVVDGLHIEEIIVVHIDAEAEELQHKELK
jgi:hypothetical protein